MSWKHEEPLIEYQPTPALVQTNLRETDRNGEASPPRMRLFGSHSPTESSGILPNTPRQELPAAPEPTPLDIDDIKPAQTNLHETDRNGEASPRIRLFRSPSPPQPNCVVLNPSEQELPAALEPMRLGNGDIIHFASLPGPRSREGISPDAASAANQRQQRRSASIYSAENEQGLMIRTSLEPDRPSRVSKPRRKRGPVPRWSNAIEEVQPDVAELLLFRLNVPQPPHGSRCLQGGKNPLRYDSLSKTRRHIQGSDITHAPINQQKEKK